MHQIYLYSTLILNLISFLFMRLDKERAIRKTERISEMAFVLFSLFGGFFGIYFGALVFHHKTAKRSFQLKVFFASMIYIVAVYQILKITAL